MYPLYRDLRDKLGEPLWHDEHGVPRYSPFAPGLLGIYDDWAVSFSVRCQACGRHFPCAVGLSTMHKLVEERDLEFEDRNDPAKVLPLMVGWGDAPWHDGDNQCSGTTMTTDIDAILEVWHKERMDWAKIEIPLSLANQLCCVEAPDE